MLDIYDAPGQAVRDFDGLVTAQVMEGGSLLLPRECVIEIGVDVVYVCADEVHPRCVDEVAIDDALLVNVLSKPLGTQRLTLPLASPLRISELLQKTEVMVSP